MDFTFSPPALAYFSLKSLVSIILMHMFWELAFRRSGSARLLSDGWKTLEPTWMITFPVVGFGLCSIGMWFLFTFVGSKRVDAESQEFAMLLIALALTSMTFFMYSLCQFRKISWKSGIIRLRYPWKEKLVSFSDLSEITYSRDMISYRIVLEDGTKFSIPSFYHGIDELMNDIDGFEI